MVLLLAFAVTLLVAVLLSDLAERSVLSTAVLFLVAGILGETIGLPRVEPTSARVQILAQLALVTVLYTDGMKTGFRDLAAAWRLPGRALLLGMPLTLGGTALLAHWLCRLSWVESLLVGAVLSPTDPVFAAAIVGSETVPERLRQLLNVESGMNDGLALPIVLGIIGWLGVQGTPVYWSAVQVLGGIAIGVIIPWAVIRLEESRFFAASSNYQSLLATAIFFLVFGLSSVMHMNEFLACFAAGITVSSVSTKVRDDFHQHGEWAAELLKLAALLIFGALFSLHFFHKIGAMQYLFAAMAVVLVRPIALELALLGSALNWRERLVVAWFGPKGFASVIFGILVYKTAIPNYEYLFELIVLAVGGSIVAHSSTDVLIARWFRKDEPEEEPVIGVPT